MKKVDKDMVMIDIIQMDRGVIPIMLRSGMHCVGCPSSQGETLEEACMVHDIDADQLIEEINFVFGVYFVDAIESFKIVSSFVKV